MGNCDCYGQKINSSLGEFSFKERTTESTASKVGANSSVVLPIPRLDTQRSTIARSTIKMEVSTPVEQSLVPQLKDLVKKTLQELPELEYDEVEHGQHYGCQPFFDTNNIYEGQMTIVDNVVLPHGRGNLYYTDGSFFTGTFVNGKAQGKGRLVSANGSYYEGTIRENRMEGRGQYRDANGTYEGMMLSGVPHGQGIFRTDKLSFQGRFEYGEKVFGTLVWGDNQECTYVGSIKNDMFDGKGKLSSPAGTYEGGFVNGLKDGFGVFTWNDGKKFEGSYIEDVKCGYGEYYDSDGTPIYKGQWIADKPYGQGIEFKRDTSTNKLTLMKVQCTSPK